MNRKAESTIKPKPEMPGIENWISGGANQNQQPASPVVPVHEPVSASQPASLLAGQHASLPAGKVADAEASAMLSVRIPRSLQKRLRIHCATHDIQIQDVVARLIAEYLTGQEPAPLSADPSSQQEG